MYHTYYTTILHISHQFSVTSFSLKLIIIAFEKVSYVTCQWRMCIFLDSVGLPILSRIPRSCLHLLHWYGADIIPTCPNASNASNALSKSLKCAWNTGCACHRLAMLCWTDETSVKQTYQDTYTKKDVSARASGLKNRIRSSLISLFQKKK